MIARAISSFRLRLGIGTWTGIVFVTIACACWAYAFIIPVILASHNPAQIVIYRYLFYGVFSLALFSASKKKRFSLKIWLTAFVLALTGNVLYYFFLIIGINLAGPEIAIPIGGMIPVTVALLGNITLREFTYSKIFLPLTIMFGGLLLINFGRFTIRGDMGPFFLIGLVACFTSLALWSWYGVQNAAFLKRNHDIAPSEWTNLVGIMTLVQVLVWGGIEGCINPGRVFHFAGTSTMISFLFWCATLGILSSWLGTATWNFGAQKLPVTVAGQIIIMEPIFGVLYVYLLKGTVPVLVELVGFVICFFGIFLTLKRITDSKQASRKA